MIKYLITDTTGHGRASGQFEEAEFINENEVYNLSDTIVKTMFGKLEGGEYILVLEWENRPMHLELKYWWKDGKLTIPCSDTDWLAGFSAE
jgi:hypothetical protein